MIHSLPLANVVLGISFTFYFGLLLFFVIIVPIESFIFSKLEKIAFSRIILFVFFANIISWILGFLISATKLDYIPPFAYSDYNEKAWVMSLFSSFITAFFLSWITEYAFLKLFQKRLCFLRLFKTSFYANMFSYLAIYIIAFGGIIIQGLFF